MASLISQMRNEQLQPQPMLNDSINQVKNLMYTLRTVKNPQQVLANMIQSNPQLASLCKTNNLEQVARSLAAAKGIDINSVINQLLH